MTKDEAKKFLSEAVDELIDDDIQGITGVILTNVKEGYVRTTRFGTLQYPKMLTLVASAHLHAEAAKDLLEDFFQEYKNVDQENNPDNPSQERPIGEGEEIH